MRRASAASMAAEETAPLSTRIRSSHSQDGARPVTAPMMISPMRPQMMIFFLPLLSERLPSLGDMMAEASEKLLVKMPMEATVAPSPIA